MRWSAGSNAAWMVAKQLRCAFPLHPSCLSLALLMARRATSAAALPKLLVENLTRVMRESAARSGARAALAAASS